MKPICKTTRRRGMALIAVLWIALLAGLVLMGVSRASTVNLAMGHSDLAAVQARWLARAGIEQAIALLADDGAGVDSALDFWYEDPFSFQEVQLSSGTFSVTAPAGDDQPSSLPRYGVMDLGGLINVNTVEDQQFARLRDVDPAVIDAIIDWRDQDENSRPGGAERGYYQRLDLPYEIRNAPFETHDELLLVKGVDRQVYFGEDTNRNGVLDLNERDGAANPPNDNADNTLDRGLRSVVTVYGYERNEDSLGTPRIDVNRVDTETLKEQFKFSDALAAGLIQRRSNREFENLFDLLDVQPAGNQEDQQQQTTESDAETTDDTVTQITMEWLAENMDRLTTSNDERLPARINLNTAPRQVLRTLPQVTDDDLDAIIGYRRSGKGPFYSIGELFTANVVEERIFRAIAEFVTVRSNVFEVTATGESSTGIRVTITAIVDRGAEPMRILYWREGQ